MADPQTIPSPPSWVPGMPVSAPTQTVKVVTRDQAGNVVFPDIPVESFQYAHANAGIQLALPVINAQGLRTYIPANDWAKVSSKGWKFDPTDRTQVPAVTQLMQELQNRSPDAAMRFLAPWGNAVVSSLPEDAQKALSEGRLPTGKEAVWTAAELQPYYQMMLGPTKAFWDAMVAASKKESAPERSAWGVASLIPFAPNVAAATEKLTAPGPKDVAGALGEASIPVVAAVLPTVVQRATRAIEAHSITPEAVKRIYNRNLQGVVSDLTRRLPEGDVTGKLYDVAKAQVGAAKLGNLDTMQAIERAGEQSLLDKEYDIQSEKLRVQHETLQAEQARRVHDLASFRQYANEVTGLEQVDPWVAANEAIRSMNGDVGAFLNEIESRLYEPSYQMLAQEGVRPGLSAVRTHLERVMAVPAETQAKMGTSTLPPGDLIAGQKMRALASGLNEALQGMALGDAAELSENQRAALAQVLQEVGGERQTVPFSVADEASRGLGKVIRKLQRTRDPENATRLRAWNAVRDGLRQDMDQALVGHPEAQELLEQARRVTTEQHNVMDRNIIRGFYANERYRLPADALTRYVLQPRSQAFHRLLMEGLTVGPEALRGMEMAQNLLTEEQATRLAQRLADTVRGSEAAQRGLRATVVDEMLQRGTVPSSTPGVTAPTVDYNRMAAWLQDRPGAKILLGGEYQPLLEEMQRNAAAKLQADDPALFRRLQVLQARREQMERAEVRRGIRREKAVAGLEAEKAPSAATAMARPVDPISLPEFVKKVIDKPSFRDWVRGNTTPQERLQIARGIVQRVVDDSMEVGQIGSPDAVIDVKALGKGLENAGPALQAMGGDARAVQMIRGLGRAIENARVEQVNSIAGRFYGFMTHLAGAVRMSWGERTGSMDINPQRIYRQMQPGRFGANVELPIPTRPFVDDVLKASQDPELAAMMRKALKITPTSAGAGAWTLRYLLAFSGDKQGSKRLDDKAANALLLEAGGDIQKAAELARTRGY